MSAGPKGTGFFKCRVVCSQKYISLLTHHMVLPITEDLSSARLKSHCQKNHNKKNNNTEKYKLVGVESKLLGGWRARNGPGFDTVAGSILKRLHVFLPEIFKGGGVHMYYSINIQYLSKTF